MKIFNIGTLELLFIILMAFIVLGPRKAIKTAGEVGQWIRDLVRSPFWREIVTTSNEIRDLPRKMMDEVDLQNTIDDLDRSTQEINETLTQVQGEVENQLNETEDEINQEIQTDLDFKTSKENKE